MPAHHPNGQDPTACPAGPRRTHRKRAKHPLCPFPPPRRPTLGREIQQRQGQMSYALTRSSQTEKKGGEESHSAILWRKVPTHPCASPEGAWATLRPHQPTATPRRTRSLSRQSIHPRAHAQYRLGRVHILHTLGVAGGARTTLTSPTQNAPGGSERTHTTRPSSTEETHPTNHPTPFSPPSPETVYRHRDHSPKEKIYGEG